jgi:hypothetical protein
MRQLVVFIFLMIGLTSFSHEYYFAFAELKYNEFNQQFEGTIIVSSHDFEHLLKSKKMIPNELPNYSSDSILLNTIQAGIGTGFSVEENKQLLTLAYIGFEKLQNGLSYIHFTSNKVENPTLLNISFNLLMPVFQNQQNKVTIYFKNKTFTEVFLNTQSSKEIQLL